MGVTIKKPAFRRGHVYGLAPTSLYGHLPVV